MSLHDPFGQSPAPISNPEAWPPNYADGFNQAVHLMTEAFPSVLASLAGGSEPVPDVAWDNRLCCVMLGRGLVDGEPSRYEQLYRHPAGAVKLTDEEQS